jgi:hypothetical protein
MGARVFIAAGLIVATTVVVRGQGGTAEGVSALARGDVFAAARILQPIAENWRLNDPAAQFFMGTLYETGRGAPLDPLRACALYQRAMQDEGPFGQQAGVLHKQLFRSRGAAFLAECTVVANLGLNHQFEPVTFTLGAGHEVAWTVSSATVTYAGKSRHVPIRLGARGAVFLPLRHTRLTGGASRTRTYDYIEATVWQPSRDNWNLHWFLFEVVRDEVAMVADTLLLTVPASDAPALPPDSRDLISLRVDAHGNPEYLLRDAPRPVPIVR